ncbi:ATP-binding protein [Allomuricauda sp. SCSIO 65647]|uniref:hybrid sensor histidine kinase/response regulator n=1 Tax=Allomuricauda sp. SCSIO 65647 TaxID=2908843 RepID=UPI001F3BB4C9|nr:ATP-binding protein [Muricauda sp. SCSIO 65647]UJH69154.1 ATP-binding protein [Muricauda sp. SCSIO 65647]
MLERYKQQYIGKNIQFVFVDDDGTVRESDQTIFRFQIGFRIAEVHPFFETLSFLEGIQENEFSFNCVHLEVDDNEHIVDIRVVGQEAGILMVIIDHTQYYQEYQTVAQARNESIIKAELIVLKNKELEERERFKNRFIQNFSHELRNPLTGIVSITNILSATDLNVQQRQLLDFLKEANTNLKSMLEDILSISMMASGKLALKEKAFKLSSLLELLEFTYGNRAKNKGLQFSVDVDERLPEYVEGDRLRLYQVLTNLLENAVKYTESGTVSLTVHVNQKRANKVSLHFEVSDTGMGISPENHVLIFESFSRLDRYDNKGGVGIGLTIVKGLLELMGSEIKMESHLEKGTRFYFDLTLKYPLYSIKKSLIKSKGRIVENTISKRDKKYRLLLVEDDERVQMTLFKILADTEHFYIELANDGARVIEEVINNTYDLIVMDVNLPNASGDHLTHIIRELPFGKVRDVPIIGITANAFDEDIKRYLRVGMNQVITKPFEAHKLLEAIYNYLK